MKNKKEKKESILKRLLKYSGKHKKTMYAGLILSGISSVVVLFTIIYIWKTVELVLLSYPDISYKEISPYGIYAFVFAIVGALLYVAALMCTHITAFRVARNMRTEGIKHLMKLPLGYFDNNGSGKIRRILSDNITDTENYMAHQLPDLIGSCVTPVATIAILFIFDFRLGLISFIGIMICFLPYLLMMGISKENMKLYTAALNSMNNEAVEYVRGIPVIKTFGSSIFSFKKFTKTIEEYKSRTKAMAKSYKISMVLFQTLLASISFIMVYSGLLFLPKEENTLKLFIDIIFYILFLPTCNMMIMKLMWLSQNGSKAEIAYNNLQDILNTKPYEVNNDLKKFKNYDIEFKNVTFSYDGNITNAVEKVSFKAKQGQTIAFVGESGSGKSTLVSLIARFYDINSGKITIGGIDIKDMNEKTIMEKVSFVLQNTKLYKGTLLENILEGKPNATIEEVKDALNKAMCDDIIEKLPNGLDTIIGSDGIFLSGGEAQRIAIARAILKDSPIILLDEATAFTDPENEYKIQQALASLAVNKTVIMIAHRLSTIENVDCIYVMSNGKIIESGTHKELLKLKKNYYSMYGEYTKAFNWKKINVIKEEL